MEWFKRKFRIGGAPRHQENVSSSSSESYSQELTASELREILEAKNIRVANINRLIFDQQIGAYTAIPEAYEYFKKVSNDLAIPLVEVEITPAFSSPQALSKMFKDLTKIEKSFSDTILGYEQFRKEVEDRGISKYNIAITVSPEVSEGLDRENSDVSDFSGFVRQRRQDYNATFAYCQNVNLIPGEIKVGMEQIVSMNG